MPWIKVHQLKYLLILLFCLETAAPFFAESTFRQAQVTSYISHKAEAGQADLNSILLFSEPGTEERLEHGIFESNSFILEIFSELSKFEPIRVTWFLPQEKFNTQPPLFTLHRVLLI